MSEQPRIVVGVDGSRISLGALEWAINHARQLGASVTAISTWKQPSSYGYTTGSGADVDPIEEAEKSLNETVESIRGEHPDVTIETKAILGDARKVLVEESKDADLLVVGSHGRGELTRMMLGSVSSYCAAHAECPILVFRWKKQQS